MPQASATSARGGRTGGAWSGTWRASPSVSSRRKTAMALKPRMIVRSVGSLLSGSSPWTLRGDRPEDVDRPGTLDDVAAGLLPLAEAAGVLCVGHEDQEPVAQAPGVGRS